MDIYTDGGCINNGHPDAFGAWAFVCEDGFEASEFVDKTTNNRTELQAVIEAMRYAKGKGYRDVRIILDSQLTMFCAQRKWKRKANRDLWVLYDHCDITPTFQWVRGHSGVPGNERADWLCNVAMRQKITKAMHELLPASLHQRVPARHAAPELF